LVLFKVFIKSTIFISFCASINIIAKISHGTGLGQAWDKVIKFVPGPPQFI
jgi:hypothetical protein